MKNSYLLNRRDFVRTGLLGSITLSMANVPAAISGVSSSSERDPDHGLKLGLTSYTLRKFSLDQAIAMTREAGVKYISLKDMHLPMKSTPAERREVHKKIDAAGLVLMGGGVIYIKNNADDIRA